MSTISSSTFYPNEDISRITITNNKWLISFTSFIYLDWKQRMLIRNGASGTFTSFGTELVYWCITLFLPRVCNSFFLSLEIWNYLKMAIKNLFLMNFNDASQLNAINFYCYVFVVDHGIRFWSYSVNEILRFDDSWFQYRQFLIGFVREIHGIQFHFMELNFQ